MVYLRNMISVPVQDTLQERGILSLDDIDSINCEKTLLDRNVKLMQLLLKKKIPEGVVIGALCKGLCQSAQYCPFRPQENEPLCGEYKDALELNRRMLIENLEVLPVLDHMHQAGFIDRHLREVVESKRTRRGRVDRLLLIVNRLHTKAYLEFMNGIKQTQPFLYDDLPNTFP